MNVLPGNASHIGSRFEQQDAFALSDFADADFVSHGGYLAVVADGIGGLLHGMEAANTAVTHFVSQYMAKPRGQSVEDALDAALATANDAVCAAAKRFHCLGQMGTTLVAALIQDDHLYWRAVGDSHLYLCRDDRLSQLNADHNLARSLQILVNEGVMSQDEADHHPERHALEYYLGLEGLPMVERNRVPLVLQNGDKLLLCSDGVDGALSAEEIMAALSKAPMTAAQALCDKVLAKRQPFQDNLTAVVLAYQA